MFFEELAQASGNGCDHFACGGEEARMTEVPGVVLRMLS